MDMKAPQDGNDHWGELIKAILDSEIPRERLAHLAGLSVATVHRFINRISFSEQSAAKISRALKIWYRNQENRPAFLDDQTIDPGLGDFLLPFRSFDQNLKACRVDVILNDHDHSIRLAFIAEGGIRSECTITDDQAAKLIRTLSRIYPEAAKSLWKTD